MFQIGDIIFYPIFGAGYILNIEDREIHGEISKYYLISLIVSKMNVMVPVYSKEALKIREAVTREDISKVFDILKQSPQQLSYKWVDRYKLYCESIKNGDIFVLSGILRDIAGTSKKKTLSKSDLKCFKDILNMVRGEASLVLGLSYDETKITILECLKLPEDFC